MNDQHHHVLEVLGSNARLPIADIARLTGLDEADTAAVIADLEDDGIIRGYHAIVDWDRADTERARAAVELNVTLDRETGYDDVAARLVEFTAVTGLQLVSGNYDFLMTVEADSVREISQFVSEQVAPIPEVTQTVTHFVMETYKEHGVRMGDGGDDERLSVTP